VKLGQGVVKKLRKKEKRKRKKRVVDGKGPKAGFSLKRPDASASSAA
jgi:hypothetical protein